MLNVEATPAGCVESSATPGACLADDEPVENDVTPDAATPEDDRLVAQIRDAVVAGDLGRDLASIRKFLHCGQPKAIRLNRLYIERFGKARGHATAWFSRCRVSRYPRTCRGRRLQQLAALGLIADDNTV